MFVRHLLLACLMDAAPSPAALVAQNEVSEVQVPAVLVLDFDGEELEYVPDTHGDPSERITPFNDCAGTWPPYGDPSKEAELLEQVRTLFRDYDVIVTDEEPCGGPYVRAVIGPFVGGCGAGIGYAESSCERPLGHGMIYVKFGAQSPETLPQQATAIAHEYGHALGLAHVDNQGDIMNPSVGTGEKTFVDTCNPPAEGSDVCQRTGFCPRGQNSHFGLLSVLGPSSDATLETVCAEDDADASCSCRTTPASSPFVLLMAAVLLRRRAARCIG